MEVEEHNQDTRNIKGFHDDLRDNEQLRNTYAMSGGYEATLDTISCTLAGEGDLEIACKRFGISRFSGYYLHHADPVQIYHITFTWEIINTYVKCTYHESADNK